MSDTASTPPEQQRPLLGLPRWMTGTAAVATVATAAPFTILTAFGVTPLFALLDSFVFAGILALLRSHRLSAIPSRLLTAVLLIILGLLITFTMAFGRKSKDEELPRPLAVAIASTRSGLVPLRVVFDASSSRGQTTQEKLAYAWDLDGNGTFDDATMPRPEHTYVDPGSYAAQVRVTGANGETSLSRPIAILAKRRSLPVSPPKRKQQPPPRPRTQHEDVVMEDTPATASVFELRIAAGQEEDIQGESALRRLARILR